MPAVILMKHLSIRSEILQELSVKSMQPGIPFDDTGRIQNGEQSAYLGMSLLNFSP